MNLLSIKKYTEVPITYDYISHVATHTFFAKSTRFFKNNNIVGMVSDVF